MNTAREVLDVIDKALTSLPPDESRKLWDVLAALRGPDGYDNCGLKLQATVPIRRAAFPLTTALCRAAILADFGQNRAGEPPQFNAALLSASAHFDRHALWAATALGLYEKPPGYR